MTAGNRTKYKGHDPVGEFLLSQVSKHVKYDQLGPLSRELGVSDTDYQLITAPNTLSIHDHCFKVLELWCRKLPGELSVRHLVGEVKLWQREGYVDRDIWRKLAGIVNPDVLKTSTPSGGHFLLVRAATSGGQCVLSSTEDLQTLTRESLTRAWRNSLSNDWIQQEQAGSSNFPVDKYYIDLELTQTIKGPIENTKIKLNSIYDVLDDVTDSTAGNILMEGPPGIGKSSTVALLALNWVKKSSKLKDFDFVFTIRLKYADKTSSLAELIIAQHDRLKALEVPAEQIEDILKGRTRYKTLLILDGYDEYKRGTNQDIDGAIESTLGNCFLLLTSRSGNYVTKHVRDKMDFEITVEGFSPENIFKCSTLFLLNNKKMSSSLMEEAKLNGSIVLLHVPIVLLMVCVVYYEMKSLPKTKTRIVGTLFELVMDRATLKIFGKKSSELENLENLLYILGEFSWKALQAETHQLLLNKEELDARSPDIMKLGLLFVTKIDVASTKERPTFVCFEHQLLQEYSGSYYIVRLLQNAPDVKAALEKLLPSWDVIQKNREVLTFTRDLLEDPSELINHIRQKHKERKATDDTEEADDDDHGLKILSEFEQ